MLDHRFNLLATFVLCSIFVITAAAQKHDYYWVSGYSGGMGSLNFGGTDLDFNTWPPRMLRTERSMDFISNSASVCDEDGRLLFYTNGCYLNGFDHQPLLHGGGLNPGFLADAYCSEDDDGYRPNQGSLFIPAPGHPDWYYLFHLGLAWNDSIGGIGEKFYYTLLNKTLDGGRGDVVEKNQIILEDTLAVGYITAVKHANGRDWWIIVPELSTPTHYKLLLTDNGVEQISTQDIGHFTLDDDATGNAVFSPDGQVYARYDYHNQVNVFQFDRCTGTFFNPIHWELSVPGDSVLLPGSVAISPNSRYLYVSATWQIFQYDLWADDIPGSETLVATYDGGNVVFPFPTFYIGQLAPDGRIYVNCTGGVKTFHLIKMPDRQGVACQVKQRGLPLHTYNGFSMCLFPNYRLGPIDGSVCDSLGIDNFPLANFRWDTEDTLQPLQITFTNLSAYEPVEWHWNFGDNTTSNEKDTVHVFPTAGIYEVCLTVSNANGSDTQCYEVPVDVIVGVETPQEEHVFNVYPVPFQSDLFIELILQEYETYTAILYNSFGQVVETKASETGKLIWNLDHLPSGVYFLLLNLSSGIMQSKVIVKN